MLGVGDGGGLVEDPGLVQLFDGNWLMPVVVG
jgi:hypothetical protein